MKLLKELFGYDVGLSDHTLGAEVPSLAVAMGAKVIEKHIKIEEDCGSPDDAFSLTPSQFKEMVDSVRQTEKIIGKPTFENRNAFKRSLYSTKDIKKGDILTKENVKSVRPGDGLHTRYQPDILGKKAKIDIPFATPLKLEFIEL
jgi:pseudaminic acid synthase